MRVYLIGVKAGTGIIVFLTRYISRLRYPWLFVLTLALFLFDLAMPDFIPLLDEVLLGLLAAIFGKMRKRRETGGGEVNSEQ